MEDLKQKWIEAIKKKPYVLRQCSMCRTPLSYFYEGDELYFSSACACSNFSSNPESCAESELDFYLEEDHGHLDNIRAFIEETKDMMLPKAPSNPGVREINEARWVKDEYGWYSLTVSDEEGFPVTAALSLRPHYCDRGHIQLIITEGNLGLDVHDSFPRYFFSAQEADRHVRDLLKWRLWKVRNNPHSLEALDEL